MPSLSKSKAAHFTDRIKMICPKIFPLTIPTLDYQGSEKMFSLIQDHFKSIFRAKHGLVMDLFPIKNQKLHLGGGTDKAD